MWKARREGADALKGLTEQGGMAGRHVLFVPVLQRQCGFLDLTTSKLGQGQEGRLGMLEPLPCCIEHFQHVLLYLGVV